MKNHKDEILEELVQNDEMKKEDVADRENNLMLSLVPNVVGPLANMAIGIQLEEYVVNQGNKQNK